ncbi:MFS transporter [Pseudomonas stutzeri]|nr:MFS transporter [Stutzerimonas stutzeri]
MRWPHAVRALRHRNYRLYFCGHLVSILGNWIQQVALAWLVYRLTGSAALLGLTSFLSLLPQLVLGPLIGAWIDRRDKRRLLLATQALLAVQAALLAALTALEWLGPALLVAMAALLGVLGAFDTPLRQALMSSFIDDRADLPNALALNAMLVNGSRFVGPPLAGLLLGLTGEAVCFALNALSFLALLVGLLRMRIDAPPPARGSMGAVFRQGLDYLLGQATLRQLMLGVMAVNFAGSCYAVLLPVFAKDVFGGDAATLGWLWGAAGGGALLGSLLLASRRSSAGQVRLILAASALSAGALLLFSASTALPLALAAMAALGCGLTCANVGTNILIQGLAPDALRGRVVSFYIACRFGFEALGGLCAGLLATRLGAQPTLAGAGALLLVWCLWLLPRHAALGRAVCAAQRAAEEARAAS